MLATHEDDFQTLQKLQKPSEAELLTNIQNNFSLTQIYFAECLLLHKSWFIL